MEENFQVASASVTDRGLSEKRPQNEDSYLELTQHGIFAVADGVGGAQAGDVASQMAVEILGEAFANRPENADAEDVMRVAIQRANSAIYQMSHDLPQLATMATTIVALHLSGNIATIGHVGDSRIYRIDSSGNITQETLDHSVVAEEVRAGRMTPEQAAVHPSRNVISRALGAESTVDVDMKTIMVEPNTSFILCSDGITRHIDDWELESIFRAEEDLDDVCRRLKQICYDRGAEDNLTAVVVKVKGDQQVIQEPTPIFIDESEEDTVATARSPFDDIADPVVSSEPPGFPQEELAVPLATEAFQSAEPIDNGDVLEIPSTDTPSLPETHTAELSEAEPVELEIPEEIPAAAEPAFVEPIGATSTGAIPPVVTERDPEPSYEPVSPVAKGGFLPSFLSALLLLVLGGLLGVAGMWYLFQPKPVEQQQVQPTPVLEPKAPPKFASFEQLRRDVDTDPEKYLEANKAYTPDADAADFYLKARALMRIGDFYNAKLSLLEARKRLKPNSDDAATLNMEIATAMAVISTELGENTLTRDLADWANAATSANVASNSNGAANANSANANRANSNANR